MSAVEDSGPGPHRLVAELAATPGAVTALVALQDAGGSATYETLGHACGGEGDTAEALRWLTTVGLTRRAAAATGGVPVVAYELTDVGSNLIRVLVALARALAEPADESQKAPVDETISHMSNH
jgi:hypothetical protein